MLSLSTLHTTLAHVLAPPHLHTAILFTTAGQLISYASNNNTFNNDNDNSINYNDDGNDSNDYNYNNNNDDGNKYNKASNYANPPFASNVAPNSPALTLKPSSAFATSTLSAPGTEVYADSDADTYTNTDTSVGATGGVSTGVGGVGMGIGIGALGARRAAVARGSRSKDDIRVLVGLGSELWGETKGAGLGMVDSELGRIVVVPILPLPSALPSTPSMLPSASAPPPAEAISKDESTISEMEKEKDTQKEKEKEEQKEKEKEQKDAPDAPLMLLALNGTDDVSWDEMRAKATSLAAHLAPPLSKYREYLVVAPPPPPLAGGVVPPGGSSVSGVASPARARAVHVGGRI
ncbi:hypothetical protein PLEOSDRAFT_166530 [Pleurotus ostreatus PC15]|uniref:Uncharacterized protein n=1 Tax=Pleurotus ostreatus (strain PC15) TaxID=1137138 RepID=A0A067NTQ3_PLEO1|nr:hypothetical protein PLEOSDRAFT_166530 [Pleurotus ostreatus PC15]